MPLVHLNSLFEKIADRKIMGITSKKLYKLILKADVNKHKLTYYRHKLGISDSTNLLSSEDSFHPERVISRGPFMALFKDEPIKFVNALEAAARPLFKRKKSTENSSRKSSSESLLLSVKTEPPRLSSRVDQSLKEEKSPKHRKIEDKTGMIIVADVDHDEISTVSVSPTGEDSVCSNKSFNTHSNKNNHSRSTKKKKRDLNHCRSVRKSANKSNRRKRRDSLRSVKNVGNQSGDTSVAKSLFSCESDDTKSTNTLTTMESSHHRSNSIQNIESIDIHGLANGNPLPFIQNSSFNRNPTFPYPMYNNSHFLYQYPMNDYPVGFVPAVVNHSSRFAMSELETQHMNIHYHTYHPHAMNYSHHRGSHSFQMSNTMKYEECYFFKGIARFLKKCFGSLGSHQYIFAEQPVPFFPKDQAPRKQVKSMVYDDTSSNGSNLVKDIEEKLYITQSNKQRIGKEDTQRVLSFKLKVDDEEVSNRPRLYSAPDQKFINQSSNVIKTASRLNFISTQRNMKYEKKEIGESVNKVSYKDSSMVSSHPSWIYNSNEAGQSVSYERNVKPSFHHYR